MLHTAEVLGDCRPTRLCSILTEDPSTARGASVSGGWHCSRCECERGVALLSPATATLAVRHNVSGPPCGGPGDPVLSVRRKCDCFLKSRWNQTLEYEYNNNKYEYEYKYDEYEYNPEQNRSE